MPERYFELVVTGRQLAGLIAGVALLIVAAFGLGVGVGVSERPEHDAAVAVPTPEWEPVGATPAPTVETNLAERVPTAFPPAATPAPAPTATPIPAPPPTPLPEPTATSRPRPAVAASRWVQVAALSRSEQAEGVKQRTVALGFKPSQVVVQAAEGKFRVRLGPFPDEESARRVASRLQNEGFPGAFVVPR